MSAQIIPFPSRHPARTPGDSASELALDRFAEALIQRAARQGITLSAGSVRRMAAFLAESVKNSENK